MHVPFPVAALLACTTSSPDRLDAVLAKWEAASDAVVTFSATVERIDTDKIFKTQQHFTGWAAYTKSGGRLDKVVLELKREKELTEKLVGTGSRVYMYYPSRKAIQEYDLPLGKDGKPAYPTSFTLFWMRVSFDAEHCLLLGMKATDAKERFALTLAKEDKHYAYLDIVPKRSEDKAGFARARLVLSKSTFLPRQVWLERPNGFTVQWDLPSVEANGKLDPRLFDKPRPAPGWKIVPSPSRETTE